jgi:hypothetical protein
MNRKDSFAGRLIIGGFVLGLAILVVWFALDLGGLMPGDVPVLPPDEQASVLPNT